MTEEQIKQNAKSWVKPLIGEEDGGYNENDVSLSLMENAFIAGAHSRDEKIEELKEEIESLEENERELFEGFKKRGTKLGELMKENVKLRNPWISVEEQMPEDNKTVLVWFGGYYTVAVLRDNEWWNCTGYQTDGGWSALDKIPDIASNYITHWMPIPELKKGE